MADTALTVVALDRLQDHPLNAHVVSEHERRKIKGSIRRTGRYPALIVRELTENSEYWPGEPGTYQILDGHQRRLIFVDLVEEGHQQFATINVDDWNPLTDEEALLALATLNTWGANVPRRRAELLHAITKFTSAEDAAAILPETSRQIADALKLLQQPIADIDRLIKEAERPDEIEMAFVVGGSQKAALSRLTAGVQLFATYYGADLESITIRDGSDQGRVAVLTFRVRNAAKSIIEEALKRASIGAPAGSKNKRGLALEEMARIYLEQTAEENGLPNTKQLGRGRKSRKSEPAQAGLA